MDAIGEGEPERNVIRIATSTSSTGHAVIEVTDTGHASWQSQEGAASRLNAQRAKNLLGSGIGLAVCQDIASSLRGSIMVTSDESRTCFRVQLPPAVESRRLRLNSTG